MPVKARLGTILLLLVVTALSLQGCQVSGDGDGTATSTGSSTNLALSTTTGSTFLVANGSSSVTVQLTVTDASGRGVSNTPVTFTIDPANLGSLSSASTRSNAVTRATSVTSNTDAGGVAQAKLTAGTQVGTARIIAQARGFSTVLSVNFISGTPTQVVPLAIPSTVGVNTTSTIVATVSTATGALVEGVTVTFTLAVNNSGARLSSTSGTTNANGEASVTYTAGSVIGTDTVRASVTGNVVGATPISVQATTITAAALQLLVSSPQMDSDGSETVTLTALVGDANRNAVAGVPVAFVAVTGCDVACITVTTGTTNASGRASAVLDTGGDPTNRDIMIRAVAGTFTSTNTVKVTGTTITISGASTLVQNDKTTLSILLRDSGGNGIPNEVITLSSSRGNTLSATTVTTDSNGQGKDQQGQDVTVTAIAAGTDIIQVTALDTLSAKFTLTVSDDKFFFTTPASEAKVKFSALPQTITVHWDKGGTNQVGEIINFFATRGTLSATSAPIGADGNASVTISSTNAGPSVITATPASGGPSSQLSITFVATTPASLILQASPTTLGVNAGGSTDQQSIITAIVRDVSGNLVQDQTVSFKLIEDVTSGSIFPASAITDSFGRASTVYTAGAVSSAQDGVRIDATVAAITSTVRLTVSQQALFVVLGTGNTIQALSNTQYAIPYSVLVTDVNSNPVANARVELNVFPIRYQKGFYVQSFDAAGNFVSWVKFLSIVSAPAPSDDFDQACNNEDVNRNGRLDPAPLGTDLDTNSNGELEPGNVATVPISVTTNATGFQSFDVVYAKEFTWVEIELEARATVAGSEGFSRARFFLPGLASDFTNRQVAPPGAVSPYGRSNTCACDELFTACTLPGLNPVVVSPSNAVVAAAGGSAVAALGGAAVSFSVTGGSQTSYTISSTAGTPSRSLVTPSQTFTLDVIPAGSAGTTITITARDTITGQTGTAVVTRQ